MDAIGGTDMYSEAYQDEFVDLALNKQNIGFFVDAVAGGSDESR